MDLKSPFTLGHSVAVAALAEEAGRRLYPYLTERMLRQSAALAPLGEIVVRCSSSSRAACRTSRSPDGGSDVRGAAWPAAGREDRHNGDALVANLTHKAQEMSQMAKAAKDSVSHVRDFGFAEDRTEDLGGYTVNFVTIAKDHDSPPCWPGCPVVSAPARTGAMWSRAS